MIVLNQDHRVQLAGYFFGNIPIVRQNFELVIVAILVISVLPMVYEWLKARQEKKTEAEAG